MLKGWFDAFRTNGGPTLYSYSNRTPVVEDIRNIFIYISFSTLFLAFLLIFPGIRKERISTFICVTTSLFVGAVILLTTFGTDWHVSGASIASPYRAFSREKLFGDIGVRIGLDSFNVTLKASPVHRHSEDINYNERFTWLGASQLKKEYKDALIKGLPFPILTVAEYLSQDMEGFSWGGKYRKAGYYTSILLWSAFAMWMVMNILLCMVPRYGAYTMALTGVIILVANGLYVLMLPKRPLVIHFETEILIFKFGWCYWTVMSAGILAVIVGSTVALVDTVFPNKFSTIFEVDYDTPYRYFVGQDSSTPSTRGHTTLEETVLTRVSSIQSPSTPAFVLGEGTSSGGVDNAAFEADDSADNEKNYGTIINGKRAVSLRNFGKFAEREAGRRKNLSPLQRKIQSFSGIHVPRTSTPPNSGEVNIDLQAASMW